MRHPYRVSGDPTATVASQADPPTGEVKPSTAQGLSQFLAKVLSQVSLTSWLPALTLVVVGTVSIQLAIQFGGPDLAAAFSTLAESALGVLVFLLFAVIVATVALQAFEFEIVRLLEGYVGNPLLRLFVARPLVRWHAFRLQRLENRRQLVESKAFSRARRTMLQQPVPPSRRLLDILEDGIDLRETVPPPSDEERFSAADLNWPLYATASDLNRLDVIDLKLAGYPRPHRLLATRLGNALRAAEDGLLLGPGENVEGYVVRHYHQLTAIVLREFEDYRSRLDMYCSLCVVFAILSVVQAVALFQDLSWLVLLPAGSMIVLSRCAYLAGVASARRLAGVLTEMNLQLTAAATQTHRPGRFFRRILNRG